MPAHSTTWSTASCDGDGRRLAEEDPGRVDARQAQAVPGALAGLDGEAALGGEHGGEQHGQPEQPGRGRAAGRPAPGPSAKAKSTRARTANGHHLPQRDPGAQLDAQVLAGDQQGVTPHGVLRSLEPRRRAAARAAAGRARCGRPAPPDIDDHPVGQRHGQVGLVRGKRTAAPPADGLVDQLGQQRPGRRRRGRRGARRAATARAPRATSAARATRRRCPADSRPDRGAAQPADEAEPLEGRLDPVGRQAGGPDGEADVLGRGELVVEGGGVAEQPDPAPHRGAVVAQVVAEDHRLARRHRQQAGAGPQQAGLAGAVGAEDGDHLARRDRRGRRPRGRGTGRRARRRHGGGLREP